MAHIDFHWGAMALSAVAAFFFGFLWYGPLFGRRWGEEMGFDMDAERPDMKEMALPMLGNLVGNFLIAYSLTWVIQDVGNHFLGWGGYYGTFIVALIIWSGFYIPMGLSQKGWEQRTWTFVAINQVFYVLNLLLIGAMVTFIPF